MFIFVHLFIFHNKNNGEKYVSNFFVFLNIQDALYAEAIGVFFTIEYAQLKCFENLYLKCDSSLLCQDFGSAHIILKVLKGR